MSPVEVPVMSDGDPDWDQAKIADGNVEDIEYRCMACNLTYTMTPDGLTPDEEETDEEAEI